MSNLTDLFEKILGLMVEKGFDSSWMNNPALISDIKRMSSDIQVNLPEDLIEIYLHHNGMNDVAFDKFRFFRRYHMYDIETNFYQYKEDILVRDDYSDSRIKIKDMFPFLSDDSNMICVCLSIEDLGGLYRLDEDGTFKKVYENIDHFLRVVYNSLNLGILTYDPPYIADLSEFEKIIESQRLKSGI